MSRLADRIKNRLKEEKESSGQVGNFNLPEGREFLKLEEATMFMDVIPYKVTTKNVEGIPIGEFNDRKIVYLHFSVGEGNRTVVCPKTIGKKCPICDHRYKLIKEDYDANKKEIGALKAKKRFIMNVTLPKESKEKLYFWEGSVFNYLNILDEELELGCQDDESILSYAELRDGKTLKMRIKTEKKVFGGSERSWLVTSKVDFIDRNYAYDESITNEVVDLDACLNVKSFAEINALFYGLEVPQETEAPVKKMMEKVEVKVEPKTEVKKEAAKREPRKPRVTKAETTDKCKFGHTFGVETNGSDDCDECTEDMFKACNAAFEKSLKIENV